MPATDLNDTGYVFADSASKTLTHAVNQCNGDFLRQNAMKQATNIKDLELPTLLPGIKVNTTHPTIIRSVPRGLCAGAARPGRCLTTCWRAATDPDRPTNAEFPLSAMRWDR